MHTITTSPRRAARLLAAALAATALPLAAFADGESDESLTLRTSEAIPGGAFSATLDAPAPGAPALLVYAPVEGLFTFSNPALPVLETGLPLFVGGTGALDASGRLTIGTTLAATGTPYEFHLQGFALDGGRWFASHGRRIVVGGGPTSFTDESGSLPGETSVFGQATTDADAADLDGDGRVDIVLARQGTGARTLLLEGDGFGGFAEVGQTRLPTAALFETSRVAAADFDGDGRVDLFLGAASDTAAPLPNKLFLQQPDGTYAEAAGLPGGEGVPVSAIVLDVEGDGDADLVLANNFDFNHPAETPDGVVLYVNQGGEQGGTLGTFLSDPVFDGLPGTDPHSADGDVVAADFDGDGDQDLYVARADSDQGGVQNQLYLNDGAGVFVEATAVSLPAEPDNSHEATAADFDGNGTIDLFVANSITSDPVAVHLALNTGNTGPNGEPVFVDASANVPADLGPVTDIRLTADHADVDGDGDVDVLVGVQQLFDSMGNLDGRTVLLLNQGGLQGGTVGTFEIGTGLFTGSFIAGDVCIADFDGDNDPDLYVGSTGDLFGTMFADELHLNDL